MWAFELASSFLEWNTTFDNFIKIDSKNELTVEALCELLRMEGRPYVI